MQLNVVGDEWDKGVEYKFNSLACREIFLKVVFNQQDDTTYKICFVALAFINCGV
jgi:hypothetical protein